VCKSSPKCEQRLYERSLYYYVLLFEHIYNIIPFNCYLYLIKIDKIYLNNAVAYIIYLVLYIVPWREHDFIIALNRNFATIPYIYETT